MFEEPDEIKFLHWQVFQDHETVLYPDETCSTVAWVIRIDKLMKLTKLLEKENVVIFTTAILLDHWDEGLYVLSKRGL